MNAADKSLVAEMIAAALANQPPCGCSACRQWRADQVAAAARAVKMDAFRRARAAFDAASGAERDAIWSAASATERADLLRDRSVPELAAIIAAAAPKDRSSYLAAVPQPQVRESIAFQVAPVPAYVKVAINPTPPNGLRPLARVAGPTEQHFHIAEGAPWIEPAAAWEARAADDVDGPNVRGMLGDGLIVVESLPEAEARRHQFARYQRGEIDLPNITRA